MRPNLKKFFAQKQKFVDQVIHLIKNNGKVNNINLKQEAEYWNKAIKVENVLDGKCICGREEISLEFLKKGTYPWLLGTLCIDEGRHPHDHAGKNEFYNSDPEVVVDTIIKKLVAEKRMDPYINLF